MKPERTAGEDDHRVRDLVAERLEAAAERSARAPFPVGAVHDRDAGRGLERMGALNDDDLVDRSARERFEHRGQELALLDAAVPRRGARCEDDGGDQWTARVACSISTVSVGSPWPPLVGSPSRPILSTTSSPFTIFPSTA